MKKFGDGQQPFHAVVDIPEGDSQELTTVTDQALNSFYGELFNLLQTHGINPTATTNADLKQVARAVWAAVNAGTLFIDSGTANVKMLTHVRGKDYLYRSGNSGDNGFIIEFLNKVENTGAVTVNVFDVENNNNHFNAVPLVDNNGNQFTAGSIPSGCMVKAFYDYANNRFILINLYNSSLTDEMVIAEFNMTQRQINNSLIRVVESIDDLAGIPNMLKTPIFVKSYRTGENLGGGVFIRANSGDIVDNGIVVQAGGSKWRRIAVNNITLEMFGAKPNDPSFDNTMQINNALATEKNIHGNPTDSYYVTGILEPKGQKLIGGFKINTARYTLGEVSTDTKVANVESCLRMCYTSGAYDLSELLHIKALGFNVVQNYTDYYNPAQDDPQKLGTLQKFLDSAKTAGLMAVLGTEGGWASANPSTLISLYDKHEALFGYTIYDEPATRGISVADQDAKIKLYKGLTNKPLICTDLNQNKYVFKQKFSTDYDIFFVNSYARHYDNGTVDENIAKDLDRMRFDFGSIKAMTKIKSIYPCISAFTMKDISPYASNNDADVQRIIKTSKAFARVAQGNYGAFVWGAYGDAGITGDLRNNALLRNMMKEIAKEPITQKTTNTYLFGGFKADDWGLSEIFPHVLQKDPYSTETDLLIANSHPITIVGAATETDRKTALVNTGDWVSGVGFKGNWAATATNIKLMDRTLITLQTVSLGLQGSSFILHETTDGGYNNNLLYAAHGLSDYTVVEFAGSAKNKNSTLAMQMTNNNDTSANYRKIAFGIVICTDW